MRRATLRLSDEFFAEFLKGQKEELPRYFDVIENPLPGDAKFIRAYYQQTTNRFEILIESEDFEDIKDGLPYPNLTEPTLRVKYEEQENGSI